MKLKEFQNMPTETELPICMGSKLIGMKIRDIEKMYGIMVTSILTANLKRIQIHSNKEIKEFIKKMNAQKSTTPKKAGHNYR